jgi:hypothetical protein
MISRITGADNVGAGNDDEISGCHYPEGVITDDWYFSEDSHNRSRSQHDAQYELPLDALFTHAADADPQQVSPDHNPEGEIADDWDFNKEPDDRGFSHHEREQAHEEHFWPKV